MCIKQNTERLVKAVLSNNLEETKRIINGGDFDPVILEDVFKGLGIEDSSVPPFPLFYISLCNEIYLAGDWVDFYKPTVERNLTACRELILYWEQLGYDVSQPIDFAKYQELCAHFFDDDMEDLFWATEEQLLSLGYDRDEIQLSFAILTYDRDTIFDLLAKKVNPNVWISGECRANQCTEHEGQNARVTVDDSLCDPQIAYEMTSYYDDIPLDKMPKPT